MDTPEPDEPKLTPIQKFQAKLAASRFFTFSLLLHVVIVILAGSVVIFKHMADPPDFAPEGGSGIVAEEVSATPPPQDDQQQQQVFTPTQPTVTTPTVDVIVSNSTTATAFQMAPTVVSIKAPASDTMEKALTKAAATAMGKGLAGLPATMAGRAGGTARMALMTKNKMTDKSEKAVLAGLRWLKEHQKPDGSWGDKNGTAMTGLGVLCFLGHGETPESPEFGPTVKKAVDNLLNRGIKAQGALAGSANKFGQQDVYEHAIGCYALGEYFTMTKDDRVKDVLTQAVTYIVQGQDGEGAWEYRYAKGEKSDTSVTGWQIQALKAAHLSGLNIPGVDEALDKSMIYLKRVQNEKGAFGYNSVSDARYSLTGVGVLCTYFWKGDKDKTVRNGIKYIIETTEKDEPVEYKGAKANLYAWYYHTQACLMFGGEAWTKWNRWYQSQISDNQSPDGSWPVTGNAKPIGGLEHEADVTGQVYRTTMCVLMLEVFYRYMPTNK